MSSFVVPLGFDLLLSSTQSPVIKRMAITCLTLSLGMGLLSGFKNVQGYNGLFSISGSKETVFAQSNSIGVFS